MIAHRVSLSLGGLLLLGCGSDPGIGPPDTASISYAPAHGGTAGWLLSEPLQVTVRDGSGQPLANTEVHWAAEAPGAWLGAASSTTNAAGVATMTFAPGSAVGVQVVRATAEGVTADIPVPVSGFRATVVATANAATGDPMACALNAEGELWCWRHQMSASVVPTVQTPELLPASARPVRAAGSRTYRLLAGSGAGADFGGGRFCAVATDDSLWCWSHATPSGSVSPVRVTTSLSFTALAIAAGSGVSAPAELTVCGRTAMGQVWCRGSNERGEAGAGTAGPIASFTKVATGGLIATLRGGAGGFCATDAAGLAWCWGDNGNARLMAGADAIIDEPTRMGGDAPYVGVAPLLGGACGLRADATMHCWGRARVRYASGTVNELPPGAASGAVASGASVHAFSGGGYGFAMLRRPDGALRVVGDFFEWSPVNALVPEPIAHPRVAVAIEPLLTTTGTIWCAGPGGLRCAQMLDAPRGVPAP